MSKGLYPIRTISAMTGVNPVTLRAWERRYGLIRPQRTAKGHRLYAESDIDRIQQILVLLERGIPISQAQQVLDDEDLVVETTVTDLDSDESLCTWEEQSHAWRGALTSLDEHALEAAYSETLALFPVDLVQGRLIRPLLADSARDAASSAEGRARHHFLCSFLRNKLAARFHHQATRATGAKLLAVTPPDEPGDVGLMMAAVALQCHGYRVILLGPCVDAAAVIAACHAARCTGILLSATDATAPEGFLEPILQERLPVFLLDGATEWVEEPLGGTLIPVRDPGKLLQTVARHIPPASAGPRPRASD